VKTASVLELKPIFGVGPLVGLVFLAACGDESGDAAAGVAGRTSALCDEVTGFEALAWDYYNGVLVTDPVLPPPVPVGASFGHSAFPLLGFSHPADWTATELEDASSFGVNLIRNDGQAIWRYLVASTSPIVSAADVRDFEVSVARNEFGGATPEVVCAREASGEVAPGTGIVTEVANVLLKSGDRGYLVAASVTRVSGVPTTQAYVRVMSAPAAEFADRLYDRFLALDWQLLVGDPDDGDRDDDGWLDAFDRFPDDPTRH
jgi:hypothetical protein